MFITACGIVFILCFCYLFSSFAKTEKPEGNKVKKCVLISTEKCEKCGACNTGKW